MEGGEEGDKYFLFYIHFLHALNVMVRATDLE